MTDKQMYERLIGLHSPWKVTEVKLDMEARKVDVIVVCAEDAVWANEQGERLHIHSWEKRSWRHLDTMGFETRLHADVPRVKGPDGKTQMVVVPWAAPKSHWTYCFECFAIAVLLSARSVQHACDLLKIRWDSAQRIMDRAVERGLARRDTSGIKRVGIDEKSFGRGQDYIGVLCDLDGGRVLEVSKGNDAQSGKDLIESLPEATRKQIEAVTMDMNGGFHQAVREDLPDAEIVYDRFHVSANLNKAVDEVRRKENRELLADDDDRLKGSRQLWLFDPLKLKGERWDRFEQLMVADLKTTCAWSLKETFRRFWEQPTAWEGQQFFYAWHERAVSSGLAPVKRVANTLLERLSGLLSYFKHKITNALAESLNGRIAALKATARGFRTFNNYRTRILFFLGRLDLMPAAKPCI